MNTLDILRFEIKHFRRSKFKVIGFGLFLLACGYGLAEGFRVYAQHQAGITTVQTQAQEVQDKVIGWFDAGKTGPEDRPWVNVSTPFWAIYNSPTPVAKKPSALMPLSIGQAEQYGYYKLVSNWSTAYDSDMIEEIANPERLAAGGIDFSFAVLFLAPILLILLTYDLGGLERDLTFLNLIAVQTGQIKKWLLFRLGFYVLLVFVAILAMTLATAASTQAFTQAPADLLRFLLGTALYLAFWGLLIFAIIRTPKASNMQAFQMVATWLTLCVILPGTIHQVASLRYPASYMTDYIDASRETTDAIYEMPHDSMVTQLLALYPDLSKTASAQGQETNEDAISNSISALINTVMKAAIAKVETQNAQKNDFISATYWINPVMFFHHWMNASTKTDYAAYLAYRDQVQAAIDRKLAIIVHECWDLTTVDKTKYLEYQDRLTP